VLEATDLRGRHELPPLPDLPGEVAAEDALAISQQVAWCGVVRERRPAGET